MRYRVEGSDEKCVGVDYRRQLDRVPLLRTRHECDPRADIYRHCGGRLYDRVQRYGDYYGCIFWG